MFEAHRLRIPADADRHAPAWIDRGRFPPEAAITREFCDSDHSVLDRLDAELTGDVAQEDILRRAPRYRVRERTATHQRSVSPEEFHTHRDGLLAAAVRDSCHCEVCVCVGVA